MKMSAGFATSLRNCGWRSCAISVMGLILLSSMPAWADDNTCVSYLGPVGTYTEEAAQFFFRDGETLNPRETVVGEPAGCEERR